MSLPRPARPDALRPTVDQAAAAWAERVRADHEQVERCREVDDPTDFYAPLAQRFAHHPGRTDEPVLDRLLELAHADETWLDIGSGGGRYALPLARRVRHVTAVDPSPAMLEVLRSGMASYGIHGIDIIEGRWPSLDSPLPRADATLMAHVGYDIADIVPFLAAAEAVSRRLCVAIMGEGATTTAAALFWSAVHGEPRVSLPALPELISLLLARQRLPSVVLAERTPPAFVSRDELLENARRQLWVRAGSAKDARLSELVLRQASEREAGWSLDWQPTRVGIVTWEAAGADTAQPPRAPHHPPAGTDVRGPAGEAST